MCVRYYSFLLLYSVLYSFSLRGSLLNPVPVHF